MVDVNSIYVIIRVNFTTLNNCFNWLMNYRNIVMMSYNNNIKQF
jgi:hypothetical protein